MSIIRPSARRYMRNFKTLCKKMSNFEQQKKFEFLSRRPGIEELYYEDVKKQFVR